MREFKFRRWDKVHEEMLEWEDYKHEMVSDDFEDDDLVLMQYTGLRDKNNIEICEGDILEYTSNFMQRKEISKLLVRWSQIDGMFIFGHIRTDRAINNSIVIGNIFENPELLEEN